MPVPTLARQQSPLASTAYQLQVLESWEPSSSVPTLAERLAEHGLPPLRSRQIEILQVNVGKLCNQTCRHCHVDAGPDRREVASRGVLEACLRAVAASDVQTVDITGGAPEMNPHFRWFVEEVSKLNRRIIDRCNLTILVATGFDDLPAFLARHRVEIVASLPCYLAENCDSQRGDGVFERSIAALLRLNALGYGQPNSERMLSLVYNPLGPSLPPPTQQLEADYRRELRARYGVEFTRLFTITNLPISRFLDDLLRRGQYAAYMLKLIDAFNPATVDGLMCRNTLSVDWQGRLYDCDFNQMLELSVTPEVPQTIFDCDLSKLQDRRIITGRHCFGCTAGSGSSCQGAIVTGGQ